MEKAINILLVEDNPNDVFLLKEALRNSLYGNAQLFIADSIASAHQFKGQNIQLLFLDLGLPDGHGLETLRQIQEDFDCAVIILSGSNNYEMAIEAFRKGVQNYLYKDDINSPTLNRIILFSIERHKIDQKLRETEKQLIASTTSLEKGEKRLLEAQAVAKTGSWETNLETMEVTWSLETFNIFELDLVCFKPTHSTFLDYVLPEDREAVDAAFNNSFKNDGILHSIEHRIITRNKTFKWVEERWRVVYNEGKPSRAAGTCQDITQRKQTEQKLIDTSTALQKALDKFQKIMDSSLDMIISVNEEGIILQVSAACEGILGYTADEMIDKPIFSFLYQSDFEKTLESAKSVMSGQNLNNFENRYVRKNGSVVSLEWSTQWDPKARIRYGVARDTTKLRMAEKTIEAERRRLNDLFMKAPVSMCILRGKDHVFELANSVYLKLVRKSGQNIIGKTGREVFPELEDQGYFELLDHTYQTGEPFVANEKEIKLDFEGTGALTSIYQNILQQPYRDLDGNVTGIFYFGVDVTEQVLARKKIEEAERRYRQIVETSQEGIWVIDENEKTTFVNDKMCEIFEYSREEMLGKDMYYFMDEEGKRIALYLINKRKQGEAGQNRFKYISKSKKEIWVNISSNPLFNEDGSYVGALAMITDITEQSKIEAENEKLATVASLTVNAVIVTDAEGKITWVNKGFERITEFSFKEALGKKPGDILQGPDTDPNTIELMRTCRQEGKEFRVEILNYAKSGRKYWLDIEVRPLLDKNQNLIGFMAIEQDITERKKSELDMANLVKNLQSKNSDLQQFSYIVSHNLRAPIAKILGLVDIISTNEPDENEAFIQLINQEATNLDNVVKDINTIVSARKTENEKREPAFFETELDKIIQVLEFDINRTHAIISFDFSEVNEITTIRSFLYSIMYNLISNAIKYSRPELAPQIYVKTTLVDHLICLSVSDNGLGIDLVKNENKIFGLYKRFHGGTISGKGIGLNLVKTHAESLGGSVALESVVNEGSTFKVYLPKSYADNTHE